MVVLMLAATQAAIRVSDAARVFTSGGTMYGHSSSTCTVYYSNTDWNQPTDKQMARGSKPTLTCHTASVHIHVTMFTLTREVEVTCRCVDG